MDSIGNIYVGDYCGIRMINSTGILSNFILVFINRIKRAEKIQNNIIIIYQTIGYVSTLAGMNPNCGQVDGNLNVARFNYIYGLYSDSTSNQLLISDTGNNRIKVLDFNCKIFSYSIFSSINGSSCKIQNKPKPK